VKQKKKKELDIVKDTLHNNKYNMNKTTEHPTPQKQKQNTSTDPQHQKLKWATITYSGKERRKIKKLCKDTQIKITFRTQNTIQNIEDEYNDSHIYQMKCLDCPLKYAGQTGRAFRTRYKEHIQAIRNNNSNSG
jgi:hypothetical protein